VVAEGAGGVSREVVAEVYKFSRSKGSARQVLRELAEHANAAGEAWPSVARLAERTNLSARQVQRGLTRLLELRELEVVKVGGGKRRPTRYRVVPRNGATQLELAVDEQLNGDNVVGVSASPNGDTGGFDTPTNLARNGDDVVTQTFKETDSEERPPVRPPSRGPGEDLLAQVKEQLRGRLTDTTIHTWIAPIAAVGYAAGTLTVAAPDHIVTWVRERFATLLAESASELEQRPVTVIVAETEEELAASTVSRANARRRFRRAERRLAEDPQPEAAAP
jgi:hypothetical protein